MNALGFSKIDGAELEGSSKKEGYRRVLDSAIRDTLPRALRDRPLPRIRTRLSIGQGIVKELVDESLEKEAFAIGL